jgi:uncharacterized membrane protein YkvA (DUF1232 family)
VKRSARFQRLISAVSGSLKFCGSQHRIIAHAMPKAKRKWNAKTGGYISSPERTHHKQGAAQMKNILIVFGVALYVFSPIDLIPDFPVIGWFDDLAVVGYGAQSVFGPEKKKRKKKRRPQNVIDVE